MQKLLGFLLIVTATFTVAMAGETVAPEIDPATGVSALCVVAGALLVIRGRRKK